MRPRERESPATGATWLVVLLFGLVAAAVIAPALVSGKVLSAEDIVEARDPAAALPEAMREPAPVHNPLLFDAAYVFQPDLLAVRDAVRDGRLPTWAPGIAAGRPLLASQQHAATFPLTWLAFVLPFERSLALILAIKLLLAGLGTFALARALGMRTPGALLASLAFSLSPYFVAWLQHPHSGAYALLPWTLLAVRRVALRPSPGRVAAAALCVGLVTMAGHPPSALLVLAAAAAFGLYSLRDRAGARAAGVAALGASAVVGLGLAAIALLPFLEMLRLTEDYERGGGAAPLSFLLSAVLPDWWGHPTWPVSEGPSNYAERTLYAGAIPAVLGVAGLAARRVPHRGFFGALTIAALVLALDVPALGSALRDLPGATAMNLNRAAVLAVFGAAMLGGWGLDALVAARPAPRRWAPAVGVLALVPLAVVVARGDVSADGLGASLHLDAAGNVAEAHSAAAVRWLLVLGAGGLAALGFARSRHPAWIGAVVAVSAVELVISAAGFHTFLPVTQARPGPSEAIARLGEGVGARRTLGQGLVQPNLALRHGLNDPRAHDHPPVDRYSRLWTALAGGSPVRTDFIPAAPQPEKLMSLFAVRRLLHRTTDPAPDGLRTVARLEPDLVVSDFRGAFPRAWVAYGSQAVGTAEEALARVVDADTRDLRERPVVEGAPEAPVRARSTPARVVSEKADEVVVRARATRAGHLVLADTHFPGWRAEVDGRPAEIRPANAAFRAVAVPAGEHTIRFRYRPASVSAGLIVSGAALLVLLVLAGPAMVQVRARRPGAYRAAIASLDGWSIAIGTRDAFAGAQRRLALAFGRMARRVTSTVLDEPPAAASQAHEAPTPPPSRRRMDRRALALVVAGPLIGAVIGAALEPLPQERFRAEAVVGVQSPAGLDPERREAGWRAFATALDAPEVLTAARQAAGLDRPLDYIRDRIEALGDPRGGLVRVRATGESQPVADALAGTAATHAVALVRRAGRANLEAGAIGMTFGFEGRLQGWDRRESTFAILPRRIRHRTGDARTGDGYASVACVANTGGCGPSVRLSRPFVAGVAYGATVYARAQDPVRLRAVLGSTAADVAAGAPVLVGEDWTPLEVSWTPGAAFPDAELAVQTLAAGTASFDIDAASVTDPADIEVDPELEARALEAADRERARRAAEADRYTIVAGAQAVEEVTVPTGTSAAYGALIGLVAALAFLGFAALARRRGAKP